MLKGNLVSSRIQKTELSRYGARNRATDRLRSKVTMNEKVARRGGFEPPSPFGQWISNPSPYRAGPSPLRVLRKSVSFLKVFISILIG
jgi:hypothetical protein